ncbi:MAG: glycerol-3-phosphate acyltransferase [Ardenticatenaceae bacterium]|nr:glycerol-3-phosphate acyltransferase [Ardenticatenaceae bacterium]
MNIISLLIASIIGYLCGAVPFGFLYVKLKTGQDIRDVGSGRTGGTNSLRAAGLLVGIVTSFSDVFKGIVGIKLTQLIVVNLLHTDPAWLPWVYLVAGTMSVIGHNWSIFMRFGGGAGTGPNIGWATAIWPPMFPIGFIVMVGMLLGLGMASVASLSMAFIIPITFAILYFTGINVQLGMEDTPAYMLAGIITAAIVTYALRPNIKRLIEGNERIVGPRAKRLQRKQEKSQ